MEQPRFQLTQGDAVAWLRELPAGSVDLVITDPPYESLEKHRAVGTTTRLKHSKGSSNDWFKIFPNTRFPELFAEIYRVLAKNSHFYLFCDPETMFVAKPLAEAAGFKFWKPLIWDKCLGPETLVWTERGVVRIDEIAPGDRVALPEGGTTSVRAVRKTKSPAVRISFSDGTSVVASREHRFMRHNGTLVEAATMRVGDSVRTRPVRDQASALSMDDVIPDEDAVYELPDVTRCIWCDMQFENARAAAAHQARWCEKPVSKQQMAKHLGVRPKRWMDQPAPFRHGVLDGLIEGDGHWSHHEQRESYASASPDLAMFVRRELELRNRAPLIRRFENDHAGGWSVRFDPIEQSAPTTVAAIVDVGMQELVDISIADRDELFLLANGVVTHNCKIGMGYHYRARYECVLFFEKGKLKLNDLGIADIIRSPRVNGGYPAEKPPEVSEVLVKQSTRGGQLVIDPFMGSGSAGVSAVRTGRNFLGNDLCAEAIEITRTRLLEAGARDDGAARPARGTVPQLGLTL